MTSISTHARKSLRTLSALLLVGTACSGPADVSRSPDSPPADPVFEVATETAWAGSTIRVGARGVNGELQTLSASIGDLATNLVRADDTTFMLGVPAGSAGQQSVSVQVAGREFPAGTITVAGFKGWTTLPVNITSYSTQHWADPTDALVIGTGPDGFELVNLTNGTHTTYPPYFQLGQMVAPGPSYRPGVVLVGDQYQVVHALQYAAGEGFSSLGPMESPGDTYQVAELGPHIFLRLGHHRGNVIRYPGAAPVDQPVAQFNAEDTDEVVMSPAKNRASIRSGAVFDGLPVFTVPGGELAYRLPDVIYVDRIAFSPDGSRLAVIYKPNQGVGGRALRIYDAIGGGLISQEPLEGVDLVAGLLYDPSRALLYIATENYLSGQVSLEVRRADDLSIVGRLEAPQDVPCICGSRFSATLAKGADPIVYFTDPSVSGLLVVEFNVLEE